MSPTMARLLSLVMFDGYELFPDHEAAEPAREAIRERAG